MIFNAQVLKMNFNGLTYVSESFLIREPLIRKLSETFIVTCSEKVVYNFAA